MSRAQLPDISDLLGGIAHEINNPLSIVKGHSLQALRDHKSSSNSDKLEKRLSAIDRASDRLSLLAKIIATLSRPLDSKGPEEELKVKETFVLIGRLLKRSFSKHNIDLQCEIPDEFSVSTNMTQFIQTTLEVFNRSIELLETSSETPKNLCLSLENSEEKENQISVQLSGLQPNDEDSEPYRNLKKLQGLEFGKGLKVGSIQMQMD